MDYFEDWKRVDCGYLVQELCDRLIVVRQSLDGWVLMLSGGDVFEPSRPDFIWASPDVDGLEGPARFLQEYFQEVEKLRRRPDIEEATDLGDGVVIIAAREGGTSFKVTLTQDGEVAGKYNGFLNEPLPSFVLGEITIHGAANLSEQMRGKGLGDKMRDAAEAIMELKAVPHGLNFTQGSLSPSAEKSWLRRAAQRKVPGLSPDLAVDIRRKLAREILNRAYETRRADSLASAVQLSRITDCDIMVGYCDGKPIAGWALSDEGLPVSTTGAIDEMILRKKAVEGANSFGTNSEATFEFKRLKASLARNVVDREYMSFAYNGESHAFVQRMAERMRIGDLPAPVPPKAEREVSRPLCQSMAL